MAIEAIQADAAGLKDTIDAFGQEVRDAKDTIAGFVQNPLDVAANKLLIPAAISIINGLRAKKDASLRKPHSQAASSIFSRTAPSMSYPT